MTPDDLLNIGCRDIHYNQKLNGGYHEYYLPLRQDTNEYRLSVTFDDPEHPTTWLVTPSHRYHLKHIKTINQFQQMYVLLTGQLTTDQTLELIAVVSKNQLRIKYSQYSKVWLVTIFLAPYIPTIFSGHTLQDAIRKAYQAITEDTQ